MHVARGVRAGCGLQELPQSRLGVVEVLRDRAADTLLHAATLAVVDALVRRLGVRNGI